MILRTLLTIANIGAFGVAIAVEILYPVLSLPILYGLLIWFIASLFVFRLPALSRPIGRSNPSAGASGTPSTGAPNGGPLAANPLGSDLGFCLHCGALVGPGTAVCPSCGRSVYSP